MKKMLIIAAVFGSAAIFAQNIITNPGFEEPLGKQWNNPEWVWKSPQGKKTFKPQITDKVAHTGKCSLLLAPTTEQHSTWLPMKNDNNRFKLPEGMKKCTLSMWVKNEMIDRKPNEQIGRLEFTLTFYSTDKTKKGIGKTLITPWEKLTPEWTLFTADYDVPEGYTEASLLLKFSGSSKKATTTWVDDLYFGPQQEKK